MTIGKSVKSYESCIQITCSVPLSKAYDETNSNIWFSTHVTLQRPRKLTKKFQKIQLFRKHRCVLYKVYCKLFFVVVGPVCLG